MRLRRCVAGTLTRGRRLAWIGDSLWQYRVTMLLQKHAASLSLNQMHYRRLALCRNMSMRYALSSLAPKFSASVTEHEAGTVFEALLASCDESQRIGVADDWVARLHRMLFESSADEAVEAAAPPDDAQAPKAE